MKALLDRDLAKIEKARYAVKESLLTMKKTFEKTEEYLMDAKREDELFSKNLIETYPDLKLLDDVKVGGDRDDNPRITSPGTEMISASESLLGI